LNAMWYPKPVVPPVMRTVRVKDMVWWEAELIWEGGSGVLGMFLEVTSANNYSREKIKKEEALYVQNSALKLKRELMLSKPRMPS